MPTPRLAFDPWRDAKGTPIPPQCRVEQIAGAEGQGALLSRLHQQGQVISRGAYLPCVRFDHDNQLISMWPHLLAAADRADVGVVYRADENRASRAVVVVMVAARSARCHRGDGGRAAVVCTVAAGCGRAGTRGGVIVSRRGPGRAARG